ncbi:lysophospholipid acyltransferase family protein [Pelagibacterales bacterium]|nr:lysophospholipid acyltransferase family protein [Pelagibacterales bacterium]
MIKIILKNYFVKKFLSLVGALYVYIVYVSSKKIFINKTSFDKLILENESFIYALWHDQLLLSPLTWQTKKRIDILISKHKDGDIIADLIKYHGFNSIRGSTNNPYKEKEKNTISSIRKIIKTLRGNVSIGITPDGPRGPRHKVSEGTINISRISNKKILPMALDYKKKWVLSTWDKFIIPKPFNKICIVWGDPLDTIINKKDTSKQQETLEKSLINITEIATNHIGS